MRNSEPGDFRSRMTKYTRIAVVGAVVTTGLFFTCKSLYEGSAQGLRSMERSLEKAYRGF